jgi:YD repeat-containing protein
MSFAYTYDDAGNRTSVTKDGGNPESYTLDSLNRLTNVTYADGTTQAYSYDATGNRLSLTVNGGTPTTYTYNDGDQLTSDGTSTYAYDANGNLVSRGSDTFTWDYASRVTGATIGSTTATGAPLAVSFTYDAEDTRVGKTVSGTPTTYVWDRESGLPLLVDDGTNAYLHSRGPLGEISASAREDLITDALGSVRGVSDGSGALTGSHQRGLVAVPPIRLGLVVHGAGGTTWLNARRSVPGRVISAVRSPLAHSPPSSRTLRDRMSEASAYRDRSRPSSQGGAPCQTAAAYHSPSGSLALGRHAGSCACRENLKAGAGQPR